MADYPTLTLNDDRQIPQIGFGTWKLEGDEARDSVSAALDAGYWLIDTAEIYKNERNVGEAIGDWADIFLQTKVWNDDQGYERAQEAAREALGRLGRDYVDMLLIHWPCPEKGKTVETWKALIQLREDGLAKSIGVSNFREQDLQLIVDETGVTPAINQIELHPTFQQRELRAFHQEMGIVTQCWSPLGQGEVMESDALKTVAEEVGAPVSTVVLAWHMHHGLAPIPRSTKPNHIADNLRAKDMTLTPDQVATIDALDDPSGRMGEHPDEVN
ncbi:aldo/keto reductase [Aurantiacibacter aquimixticola]|uniref:Aldo/keto reductase n=1 Tax=Aurantiacibacter aquimixticola TaxID=1958945 RepID=A0A419RQD1_9SPHN|nr:aldo/keto reductase [Aurantiacibacter aquimixticola]RJY07977.1 aldo/keto reductase [Aurantiacibacter aquimixticola]